jgi:putative peptidoglycan lipid II flippase
LGKSWQEDLKVMAKNKIIVNFTGVSVFIILSKLLGFVRDILIAAGIGTSRMADIYLQTFKVPALLFTSIGMALSSVNIPNLTYFISKKNEGERRKYVSNLFAQISLFSAVISILGIICAPLVAKLILPGLSNDVAGVAVTLTRIMFPALMFISLAYITAGILQVHRHFMISSLISIPSNIAIIGSLLIFRGNVIALGYATTIGWLLQFLVQLPVLIKEKYRFGFKINLKNEHTRNIYRQLVPILLGNAALQLCLLTDNAFASYLEKGTTAALSFGSTLFMTVTSVFIVAMSTVTFPDLSKYCLEKDLEKVRGLLKYIFKVLFFILVPYLIIVIAYNKEIIGLVYQRGSFTSQSTAMTSTAFLLYSLCIAGYVSQEIFNRLYYALRKYKVPMILSIVCIVINFILVSLTYRQWGIVGIAGTTAVSFGIYTVIMGIMVKKDVGAFLDREFAGFAIGLIIPAACMTAVFLLFNYLNPDGIFKAFLIPLILGGLIYLLIAYFTGVLKEIISRRV